MTQQLFESLKWLCAQGAQSIPLICHISADLEPLPQHLMTDSPSSEYLGLETENVFFQVQHLRKLVRLGAHQLLWALPGSPGKHRIFLYLPYGRHSFASTTPGAQSPQRAPHTPSSRPPATAAIPPAASSGPGHRQSPERHRRDASPRRPHSPAHRGAGSQWEARMAALAPGARPCRWAWRRPCWVPEGAGARHQ